MILKNQTKSRFKNYFIIFKSMFLDLIFDKKLYYLFSFNFFKMKRHELFFWIIKLPIEFFIVLISFCLAHDIRRVTDLIPWIQIPFKDIPEHNFLIFALFWAFVFILVYAYMDLYKIQVKHSRIKQLASMIEGSLLWFLLYIWCLYLSLWFVYTKELPRLIIFFTLFISLFFIFVERFFIDWIQLTLLENDKLQKTKIALVMDSNYEEIINSIVSSKIYEIVWYYNNNKVDEIELNYLWNNNDFASSIKQNWVEEVLYISSWFSNEAIDEIFEYSRIYWVAYKYIANSFDFTKNNTETIFINKLPVVEIRNIWLTPWWRVIKRLFDFVFSWIWLIILSPLFLVIAIFELQDNFSFRNIFYWNIRVGKWWKLFTMYKFRSMKIWADKEKHKLMKKNERKDWPLFKIENDPRITKLGAFIRKYDIDELPQLWNVFIWSMSLIWPRPHLPEEVALYKDYQKRVLTLKPWITWMAQAHWRHKNSFDDEVRLDIFYIENWSFLLDLKILLKTIKVLLNKEWR